MEAIDPIEGKAIMKSFNRRFVIACLAVLLAALVGSQAGAVELNGGYHRHCNLNQDNSCILRGYICWCNILVGPVPDELCATQQQGNLDGDILFPPARSPLMHVVFHCDFGVAGDSVNVVPVVGDTDLSSEVSNALGFHSVTLLNGVYPVDYTNQQFGEAYIPVVLGGPTPVQTSTWGGLKSLYR
jgi:hypothetical protein